MPLEKLKASVNHRRFSACVPCSPCYFEKDVEWLYLVFVWDRVGGIDKKLEDVVTDHSFLYVSKIGTVCDEVGAQQMTVTGAMFSV